MTLPTLRESLEAHGLMARKSFGQHFLLDLNITRKIVRLGGPFDGDAVIEVGPGPGGLTRALLETEARKVIAVEMDVSGSGDTQIITFRTNVGDVVEAGPERPLRFVDENQTGGLKPYVLVRGRLEALVARPVMYELVGHGEEIEIGGKTMFVVRSKGAVFPIMAADQLKRLSV